MGHKCSKAVVNDKKSTTENPEKVNNSDSNVVNEDFDKGISTSCKHENYKEKTAVFKKCNTCKACKWWKLKQFIKCRDCGKTYHKKCFDGKIEEKTPSQEKTSEKISLDVKEDVVDHQAQQTEVRQQMLPNQIKSAPVTKSTFPLRPCIKKIGIDYLQHTELKQVRFYLPPTRPRSVNGQLRRSFSVSDVKKVTRKLTPPSNPIKCGVVVRAQVVPLSRERPTVSAGTGTTKNPPSAKRNSFVASETAKVAKVDAEPRKSPVLKNRQPSSKSRPQRRPPSCRSQNRPNHMWKPPSRRHARKPSSSAVGLPLSPANRPSEKPRNNALSRSNAVSREHEQHSVGSKRPSSKVWLNRPPIKRSRRT